MAPSSSASADRTLARNLRWIGRTSDLLDHGDCWSGPTSVSTSGATRSDRLTSAKSDPLRLVDPCSPVKQAVYARHGSSEDLLVATDLRLPQIRKSPTELDTFQCKPSIPVRRLRSQRLINMDYLVGRCWATGAIVKRDSRSTPRQFASGAISSLRRDPTRPTSTGRSVSSNPLPLPSTGRTCYCLN